jgi:hypothetical protein
MLRAPLEIAHDPIGELRRSSFVPEDGRALQPPAGGVAFETTGVMSGSVEPSPEDGG